MNNFKDSAQKYKKYMENKFPLRLLPITEELQ